MLADELQSSDVGKKETESHIPDSQEGAPGQDKGGRAAKRYILFVGEVG